MRESTLHLRVVAASGLWLAATLSTEGCLFQKKPRAYVPPPVRPPAPVVLKDPPYLDPAPEVEAALVELPDLGPATLSPLPPWTPPPAPVKPRPAVAQAPKPPTPPPTEALPTLPRITQILTPQQSRDYNRELDEELSRVTEALKKAAGKEEPDGGATGYRGKNYSFPETSSAGARGGSSDRSQLCGACRSPRNRTPQAPALKAAGSEGPAA